MVRGPQRRKRRMGSALPFDRHIRKTMVRTTNRDSLFSNDTRTLSFPHPKSLVFIYLCVVSNQPFQSVSVTTQARKRVTETTGGKILFFCYIIAKSTKWMNRCHNLTPLLFVLCVQFTSSLPLSLTTSLSYYSIRYCALRFAPSCL